MVLIFISLSIYPFISNNVLRMTPSFLDPAKRFKNGILLNIVFKIFCGTMIPLEFKYFVFKSIWPLNFNASIFDSAIQSLNSKYLSLYSIGHFKLENLIPLFFIILCNVEIGVVRVNKLSKVGVLVI